LQSPEDTRSLSLLNPAWYGKEVSRPMGVLCSNYARKVDLFQKVLPSRVYACDSMQPRIDGLIKELTLTGKLGPQGMKDLTVVENWFVGKGCTQLLLGCTEFYIIRDLFSVPTLDPLSNLLKACFS
jgi:hypothetical protein